MPILDLNEKNLAYHSDRIRALGPDKARLWGKMTPSLMLCHLRRTIDISLDKVPGMGKPLVPKGLRWLLRLLFFEWFTTWPKGKIKAPDIVVPTTAGEFDEEKRLLLAAMEEFVREAAANPGRIGVNPGMGPVSLAYWRHVHGVHMNHHYRQFGLV